MVGSGLETMVSKFLVVYYISPTGDNPVKDFLDSLQAAQKTKVFRVFQVYSRYGLSAIVPHTKKLTRTPLWEIRIRGKDNIRVIYLVRAKESILVLHGFIKKSQKTPKRELVTAMSRYEDWRKRY